MDKKAVKRKIIYVEWIDAVADSGWCKDKDAEDIARQCHAIGFLVNETKDSIILACTYHDLETNARMAIPKAWIKKRKVVRL